MFFVRVVSFVILSSCIGSQAYAMLARVKPTGSVPRVMRVGQQNARRLCQRPEIKEANVGVALAVGAACAVAAYGTKCWADKREADRQEAVARKELTAILEECKGPEDLEAFINRAIELGINPNHIVTQNGMTTLMKACGFGYPNLLEQLIEYGDFDINAKNDRGLTAIELVKNFSMYIILLKCDGLAIDIGLRLYLLKASCRFGNEEMVRILVERGLIDFSNPGVIPMVLKITIKSHRERGSKNYDMWLNIFQYLLSQPGIKVSNDVFDIAVREGKQDIINLLLVHAGAKDPNACGFYYEGDVPKDCTFYCKDDLSGRLHKLNLNPATPTNE